MDNGIERYFSEILAKRQTDGLLRSLKQTKGLIDFCSNDYLGLASNAVLQKKNNPNTMPHHAMLGSTGSRLLSGNSCFAEKLEQQLANFHATEAALLFNSGYDANVGVLASIPQKGDFLITDNLVHASMIDGARLSYATKMQFQHNDLEDIERCLKQTHGTKGNVFVAVESLYSMGGDTAPLAEIVQLCQQYKAYLIVDEAHATGIYGKNGEGLVTALGIENHIFARIHTFGKALGCHGAVVVGSKNLINYLMNFARPFIFSTALPPHSLYAIANAYDYLPQATAERKQLQENIGFFQKKTDSLQKMSMLKSNSQIQGIAVSGNQKVRNVAAYLQKTGFDIRPIVSPTVPTGSERLRICLHSYNTFDEINALYQALEVINFQKFNV